MAAFCTESRHSLWDALHPARNRANGEMSRFVWFLTQILDRQVVDKTGLNGFYDFVFAQPTTVFPSPDSSQPTLFDELQDQLGLRFEPTKPQCSFW
jgi:uncharacterized protein (TIGR03435 family)